jgi:hypothetical protein
MDSEWEKARGPNPSKKRKKKMKKDGLRHNRLNAKINPNKIFHRNKAQTFTLLQLRLEYTSHEISLRKMASVGFGYTLYKN